MIMNACLPYRFPTLSRLLKVQFKDFEGNITGTVNSMLSYPRNCQISSKDFQTKIEENKVQNEVWKIDVL